MRSAILTGVPERNFKYDDVIATVQMLVDLVRVCSVSVGGRSKTHTSPPLNSTLPLLSIPSCYSLHPKHGAGYKIGHIEEKSEGKDFDSDPQPLAEVTPQNLKYDMHDALLHKNGSLGCPIPIELEKLWQRCGGIPEQLNPRSMRSNLGHNTNLWASKPSSPGNLLKLQGTVGILKLTDAKDTYFSE